MLGVPESLRTVNLLFKDFDSCHFAAGWCREVPEAAKEARSNGSGQWNMTLTVDNYTTNMAH